MGAVNAVSGEEVDEKQADYDTAAANVTAAQAAVEAATDDIDAARNNIAAAQGDAAAAASDVQAARQRVTAAQATVTSGAAGVDAARGERERRTREYRGGAGGDAVQPRQCPALHRFAGLPEDRRPVQWRHHRPQY